VSGVVVVVSLISVATEIQDETGVLSNRRDRPAPRRRGGRMAR
jgi:hypothetical protein